MAEVDDFLHADYSIETPENVAFHYDLAGIGSRFIGALVDSLIIVALLVLANLLLLLLLAFTGDLERLFASDSGLLGSEVTATGGVILALYALINFLIIWGYYVLFELRWNGQSPGKRVARTRVVRDGGHPAGPLEIVVRNLVRIVDFLPWGYGIGLATMFLSPQSRRLGDYAAGTLVVKEQRNVSLSSLSPVPVPAMAGNPAMAHVAYPGARLLSPAEYALVRDVLERDRRGSLDPEILGRLAQAVAAKAGIPGPTDDVRGFLREVAESYRATAPSGDRPHP